MSAGPHGGGAAGETCFGNRETGVNYVFHASGYAGGLTPLLDRQGNPVVTAVYDEE